MMQESSPMDVSATSKNKNGFNELDMIDFAYETTSQSRKRGYSPSLFPTESNDMRSPEVFENKYFKEEIVAKLRERTPSVHKPDIKFFHDEFDTEYSNTDDQM